MLTTYRRVLARPGALSFSSAALVARMPISMIGLGIVLLVSTATGSYGLAGSVSATFLVANALLTVAQGRLLDRCGQAWVLAAAVVICTAALVLLVLSIELDWPRAAGYLAAALAGATLPAVGASVRTRWAHVVASPADLHTAFALESVLDEVVFIAGPILVTVLATGWHPYAGLLTAAALGLVGTLAYAAQRGTEPPARTRSSTAAAPAAMPWRAMLTIALIALLLGTTLGAAEVATVAFADEQGVKRWSGPLLALWAAGSLVAGVATGAVHWRRGSGSRLRWSAAAVAVAMAPLPLVGSIATLAVVLFVGGFAIAPTLIATNSLAEQTVPSARLSEGMAIVHTGIAGGVAPGAVLAGLVVDGWGASAAYLIPVAAGALLALAAQAAPR